MNDNTAHTQLNSTSAHFRAMSAADFAMFGLNEVAYVRKIESEKGTAFAIYAANGEPMGVAANHDVAFAGLRQNDIKPLSVH